MSEAQSHRPESGVPRVESSAQNSVSDTHAEKDRALASEPNAAQIANSIKTVIDHANAIAARLSKLVLKASAHPPLNYGPASSALVAEVRRGASDLRTLSADLQRLQPRDRKSRRASRLLSEALTQAAIGFEDLAQALVSSDPHTAIRRGTRAQAHFAQSDHLGRQAISALGK